MDTELWKQAYRKQFETDPDDDLRENAEDVEQWRVNWQAAYDAGGDEGTITHGRSALGRGRIARIGGGGRERL